MKGRYGRFRKAVHDEDLWADALAVMAIGAIAVGAMLRWPDKIISDIAFPIAFLIVFVLSRR